MSDVFYSETEYRASYGQKKSSNEAMDKYEEAVERMMQEPFERNQSTSKSHEEDPYEALVQKKMNSKFGAEKEKSSQIDNQSDVHSVKSNASFESHHSHQSARSQNSKKSVSSHSSCSSRNRLSEANDNLSIEEIENMDYQEIPNYPIRLPMKKPKAKDISVSHLNKKQRSPKAKKEESGNIRPVFLRNPEHGTVKEQQHLYGPFYVSWPKNKEMPPQYSELQKVYNNTHYY